MPTSARVDVGIDPYSEGDTVFLEGRAIAPGTGHAEGRRLLEQMYLRHVGSPMPAVLVSPRGKPYFDGSPWHFSISHTKAHVFCALSCKEIGIDAEEGDRQINLKLAHQILSPEELTRFRESEDKRLALLKLWVLKEAQGKLLGEGIKFHPNHTNFSPDDPRVTVLQGCLVAVIEEEDHVI